MSSDVQAKWMNAARLPEPFGDALELLSQEVLDGFHVVIGLGFERFDRASRRRR